MSMMICLLLTVSTLPVQGLSEGMTHNVLNFMRALNGYYNNERQYKEDNWTHAFAEMKSVPVIKPSMPNWAFDKVLHMLLLCRVTEDNHGIVHVTINNISNYKIYKFGQYKFEDLANLKPDDLHTKPGCEADFEAIGSDQFFGTWPRCAYDTGDGKPVRFTSYFKCHMVRIQPPVATKFDEDSYPIPLHMDLIGEKYDIPGAPEGYVYPCP